MQLRKELTAEGAQQPRSDSLLPKFTDIGRNLGARVIPSRKIHIRQRETGLPSSPRPAEITTALSPILSPGTGSDKAARSPGGSRKLHIRESAGQDAADPHDDKAVPGNGMPERQAKDTGTQRAVVAAEPGRQAVVSGPAANVSPPEVSRWPDNRRTGTPGPEVKKNEVTAGSARTDTPASGTAAVAKPALPVVDHDSARAYSESQKDHYDMTTVDRERSFGDYLSLFTLSEEELRGRRVVDFGSGMRLAYAKQAKEQGITVLSINPELRRKGNRTTSEEEPFTGRIPLLRRVSDLAPTGKIKDAITSRIKQRVPAIAAIGQMLPLRSGCVDVGTDLLAISLYLPLEQDAYTRYFGEIDRVISPGGQMNIAVWLDEEPQRKELIEKELQKLQKEGYTITTSRQFLEAHDATIFKIRKPSSASIVAKTTADTTK